MYNEVKYAKITCMSLKRTAAVFRLRKDYRNLSTEEYVENLSSYLSIARCCSQTTIGDLRNVIHGIVGKRDDSKSLTLELNSPLQGQGDETIQSKKLVILGSSKVQRLVILGSMLLPFGMRVLVMRQNDIQEQQKRFNQ